MLGEQTISAQKQKLISKYVCTCVIYVWLSCTHGKYWIWNKTHWMAWQQNGQGNQVPLMSSCEGMKGGQSISGLLNECVHTKQGSHRQRTLQRSSSQPRWKTWIRRPKKLTGPQWDKRTWVQLANTGYPKRASAWDKWSNWSWGQHFSMVGG